MIKKAMITLWITLSALALNSHASMDEAISAYERGDHQTAFNTFSSLAAQGAREAQYQLGQMYYQGEGVEKNKVKAYMWMELASKAGHMKATKYNVILKELMTPTQVEQAQQLTDQWKRNP